VPQLKLWLLDADVIIDLLAMGIFDKLCTNNDVFAASTVLDEVRFYSKEGRTIAIEFRNEYVVNKKIVKEVSANPDEVRNVLSKIPAIRKEAIHGGELESLAIMLKEQDLTFCTCDAATIRTLPFLDFSERGISVASLLQKSGLSQSGLLDRHTGEYFKNNLAIGQEEKVLHFGK
jgi:hypothetical protein